MRPEHLVMENFGPFAGRAELDFSKLEDIFLVTGKTGSGKTTIFDAICFALYGDVPGARSAYPTRLKSDHAGEEGECMVSLEFSLGRGGNGGTYLVERRPKQEIKRKRGAGAMSRDETVILWERINGEQRILGNKKGEVNQRLLELIGLEAGEFFKIVLLPQGEFAEFLRQNTSERQKVLGKLFPIEKARRIKELAARQAAEAEALEAEARRALEILRGRSGPDSYEEAIEKARASFERAKETLKTLDDGEAALAGLLSLRQREADEEERLAESGRQLRLTAEQEGRIAEKRALLARSRSARPLGEWLRSRKAAAAAAEEAEAQLRRAREGRAAAEALLAEAEGRAEENARQEGELLALRERRPALLELRKEEEELEARNRALEDTRARIGDLARRKDGLEGELAKQGRLISGAETQAAEGPALELRIEGTRSLLEFHKKLRLLAGRWETLEEERGKLEGRAGELEEQGRDLEARIPLMADELGRLREEQRRADEDDMALALAGSLKEGEACPVCGSREHPHPASAHRRRFSRKERIEGMEKTLRDLERLQSAAQAELQARRAEAERAGEELRRLETEAAGARREAGLAEPRLPLPPGEEPETPPPEPSAPEAAPPATLMPPAALIDREIGVLAGELNKLLAGQSKAREASRDIQKLYQGRESLQNTLGETGRLLAAAQEQEKHLAAQIGAQEARRRELLAFLPGAGPAPRAAEALEILNRAIAELEASLARRREEREQAGRDLAAARAAEQAASQNREQAGARLGEAESALERELAASPFAGAGEAEASLLDQGAEEALEAGIQGWAEEKIRLESQTAEHHKNLQEIRAALEALRLPEPAPLPGLEETRRLLETWKTRRAEAEGERDAAFAGLSGLERDREELGAAQKRHDEKEARARELRALADDLSGKNPQWQPFDSWLLGSYLAEIAVYATARLEKMSEYRYSLLLESQRQKGQRGYAGLDLTVFDAHTGKTRPCATLSGGESFLASISLALGLADSIQARSGGIRLDAVFIDEGFGSLDEGTLDKAMLILDELRDHRMVGLISHVGDMRSRIPCQVEVVKTASGSKILAK
jgi:exonuclease SbcC